MKILISLRQLMFGGTQVNAIELAATLRDRHGHDVVLFGSPGPMVQLVEEGGLRFLPAPDATVHPSPQKMRALRDAVRREQPDLLYVWDWWQCLEAYYGVHLPMRVPMVVTDMMMDLTRILPKTIPTTFGIPEIRDQARAAGWQRAELLLPPVDVRLNAPGTVDSRTFREKYKVKNSEITLVTVSRLAEHMKFDSLSRTIDVVRALGRELPLRFLIVGNGDARSKLERLADETNSELRRPAVVLTGAMVDPRPAYAAADIVIGMGSSALRGMAFEKPVIVVGEGDFSAPLTPETAEFFYYKGIFGRGSGNGNNARLLRDIQSLAEYPERLPSLGRFSREFVMRHFSLETVTAQLAEICLAAVADLAPAHVSVADGLRTAALYLRERKFLWRFDSATQ